MFKAAACARGALMRPFRSAQFCCCPAPPCALQRCWMEDTDPRSAAFACVLEVRSFAHPLFPLFPAVLPQRYWIKDMDTGNVYVLEAEEEGVAGASGSGRRSAGGAPAGEGRVTELLSGRELRCASR